DRNAESSLMKYEYTEKNHFKFGYSLNHPYGRRQNPQEQFVFSYGRIQKEISHWREANREAAKLIRLKFKDPLCLLFSGGTDSEACALSFMEARVPLHFACLRMKNGFNAHDILYAEKFSEKYKVKIHYFDFDVEAFFRSGELFHYTDPI